jgi:hypothetical protein
VWPWLEPFDGVLYLRDGTNEKGERIMTAEQLHILQHSLGCDQYGRAQHRYHDEGDGRMGYYRNHYVSDPTDDLRQLVLVGLMKDHGPQKLAAGMRCFSVTIHGVKAMIDHSPRPPRLTRSQQRYQRFLDADCGIPFGEWLKTKWAKERGL